MNKRIKETLELLSKYFKNNAAVQGFALFDENTTIQDAVSQSLFFHNKNLALQRELVEALKMYHRNHHDVEGGCDCSTHHLITRAEQELA